MWVVVDIWALPYWMTFVLFVYFWNKTMFKMYKAVLCKHLMKSRSFDRSHFLHPCPYLPPFLLKLLAATLTGYSGENDQMPLLPHPHIACTHRRCKMNQTPKTNLFLSMPEDYCCQRWGVPAEHILSYIHRVGRVPHAGTVRKAFSAYRPLGEPKDQTARCTSNVLKKKKVQENKSHHFLLVYIYTWMDITIKWYGLCQYSTFWYG